MSIRATTRVYPALAETQVTDLLVQECYVLADLWRGSERRHLRVSRCGPVRTYIDGDGGRSHAMHRSVSRVQLNGSPLEGEVWWSLRQAMCYYEKGKEAATQSQKSHLFYCRRGSVCRLPHRLGMEAVSARQATGWSHLNAMHTCVKLVSHYLFGTSRPVLLIASSVTLRTTVTC